MGSRACALLRSARCLLLCVLGCLLLALNALFLVTLLVSHSDTPRFSRNYDKLSGTTSVTRLLTNWSTPCLAELDAIRFTAAAVSSQSVPPSSHCPDYKGPVPSLAGVRGEAQRFQRVVDGMRDTFVFSAYYDPRVAPPVVRIIGLSGGYSSQPALPVKHCQLWYKAAGSGRDGRGPAVTRARYDIIPETHGRSYAASFHVCSLDPSLGAPYAVSLLRDPCATPTHFLKVVSVDPAPRPQVNFTVCVTPLNFNYSNTRQLVEMIEANRLFGAQRFTLYDHSAGRALLPYLQAYRAEGLVELVPWALPVGVDVWPPDPLVGPPEVHYFAQLGAVNDCLYRNMAASRFIVFTDLDELIGATPPWVSWVDMLEAASRDFQHKHRYTLPRVIWVDMLEAASRDFQHKHRRESQAAGSRGQIFPGAYLFRNAFFHIDWPPDAWPERGSTPSRGASSPAGGQGLHGPPPEGLNMLAHTRRLATLSEFYDRSKYVVWARAVSVVGVHNVIEFIDPSRAMHARVSADHGLLCHYRRSFESEGEQGRLGGRTEPPTVRDTRMLRYADEIVARTGQRHASVNRM